MDNPLRCTESLMVLFWLNGIHIASIGLVDSPKAILCRVKAENNNME